MSSVEITVQNFSLLVIVVICGYHIIYGSMIDRIVGVCVMTTVQIVLMAMAYGSLVG